jgi:hypothetical protein
VAVSKVNGMLYALYDSSWPTVVGPPLVVNVFSTVRVSPMSTMATVSRSAVVRAAKYVPTSVYLASGSPFNR